MKPLCVYNAISPSEDAFIASFIYVNTEKQMICYVLDGDSSNTDILLRSIKQCSLIGFNNKNYDDIILNYIAYQKDVNTKEIHALSEVLIDLHNKGQQPWKNEDVAFYVNRDVDSIDLSYVISMDDKQCPLEAITDVLKTYCIDRSFDILDALNRFKQVQNYGFKKNYKNVDIYMNYMNNRIGLIDI